MQLKSKYYPYPVITSDDEYYIDSKFTSDAELIQDGFDLKLKLEIRLNNPELEQMITLGKVGIAHHIECPQTCFRKVLITKEYMDCYLLSEGDVNGVIQVCSFLVALQNLEKYSNDFFSNDYKGFRFDIDKGCFMGIGNQIDLRVEKSKDDLTNTSSIISIIQNYDPTEVEMKVRLDGDKIAIILPERIFGIYSNVGGFLGIQPIMHSMVVVPALMYTLNELKGAGNQLFFYEDYRWFRSLKKVCSKLGIILEDEVLKTLDTFEIAQKLVGNPIIKSFEYFSEGEVGDDEYDEN